MIITKTPFRISFFGGGSDYPIWYKKNSGEVIGGTINKYAYISSRLLPSIAENYYKIVYSKIENVNKINSIKHPSVRECIKYLNFKPSIEIHHDSDLPSQSGLGSSSAFTVGLLKNLSTYEKLNYSKSNLARTAIHIEQNIIKEKVGSQDQIHAAYGGLNHIKFYKNGKFLVNKLKISDNKLKELNDNSILYYTGIKRIASKIAKVQIGLTSKKKIELKKMNELLHQGKDYFTDDNFSIEEFGKILIESWFLKKELSNLISSDFIDKKIQNFLNYGAYGCKLIGAGSGGFIYVLANKKVQNVLKEKFNAKNFIKFNFEKDGSEVILKE